MHYLYILYSLSGNRYYVGSSAHPNERLEHHNATEKGFTSSTLIPIHFTFILISVNIYSLNNLFLKG
jgi:predicted GIY-YIG superfamily endonuclease